jgi:5'-3' exoribonuclease 2
MFFIVNEKIQWKNISIFLNEIAKSEHELLLNEYFLRDKFDKRHFLESTSQEKDDIINTVPIIYRQKEIYICPQEIGWENRYYKSLFDFEKDNENIKTLCNNYLEGLEWVFKYYSNGCCDWRWKYNYHYPPLFNDLCKYVPHFEMDFINNNTKKNKPFSKLAQLSYVMPKSNLELLPKDICMFLKTNYSELYPEEYNFEWSFCRYFWEAHPLLPDIPLSLLEQWEIQFNIVKHR